MRKDLGPYLTGERLWGNSFSEAEIAEWYSDEENAYFELYVAEGKPAHGTEYEYKSVNSVHGFQRLEKRRRYSRALAFGGGTGEELRDMFPQIDQITVLDSSRLYREQMRTDELGSTLTWLQARPEGKIPLEDSSVDLITCFGVLHHIPNVRTVIQEFGRIARPNCTILIREPVISMGDWRYKRPGLTSRERGIPRKLLIEMLLEAGFEIKRCRYCFFGPSQRAWSLLGVRWVDHRPLIWIDAVLSRIFAFNCRYHATSPWQKVRPTACFVIGKRS